MGTLLTRVFIAVLSAAALFGVGYATVKTYNGKIEEAAKWKDAAAREQRTAKEWMEESAKHEREKERLDQVLVEREQDRTRWGKETVRLSNELEVAKRTDQTLRAWSDTPLPAFVVEQLRSVATDPGSAERSVGKDPGKSSFWNSPATVSRSN